MSGPVPAIDCAVLRRIYGDPSVDSLTSPAHAEALYGQVRRQRPEVVVEIGMAHGGSTLAILTALRENGSGRLMSIDPYQRDGTWRGLEHVAEAGLGDRHELVERPDYLALPSMLERGLRVDLAYIDGWHTFDYTLLDFFYLDRMLPVGGTVGFNDCHYPSVAHVLSFVRGHRRYERLDVGLAPQWQIRRRGRLPLARVTGRRVDAADQYFVKRETWEPDFRYWRPLTGS